MIYFSFGRGYIYQIFIPIKILTVFKIFRTFCVIRKNVVVEKFFLTLAQNITIALISYRPHLTARSA